MSLSEMPPIDLNPHDWIIVRDILAAHVPQFEVWAFGSRVKWTAKEYSDLDLAVVTDKPLDWSVNAALAEAFDESDLPIKVDVVDWASTSEVFRQIIEKDKVLVQSKSTDAVSPAPTFWRTSFQELIDQGLLEIGDGYRAKNSELGGAGPIFLRAGHVSDSHIDFSGTERFHDHLAGKVRSKMSQVGDTIVTTKGNSTGRTAYVTDAMSPFVYSPHLSYWRSRDPDKLCGGFLRYWSRGAEFIHQLSGMKISTDMAPYLSLTDQRRLKITLPPSDDQKIIARILSTLDDKIELNRRMNATLEATARAIFKSWFVDFDPVRAKAAGRAPTGMTPEVAALFPDRFEDSELGEVPVGWRVLGLDEIADFLNGLALQKYPPEASKALPVIKIAQIRKGSTDGADKASASIPKAYVVDDGDVLFSWSGSLEVEIWCGGKGALNQHLFKVTSKQTPKWFYYLWTLHHLDEFREIAADKATTMGHIQRKHLNSAKVVVPPGGVLKELASTVAPYIDQIVTNRLQSRKFATLRDTLLPKLLSGELGAPAVMGAIEKAA